MTVILSPEELAERAALEADDLSWARSDVEKARDAVKRGDVVSLDDAIADIDQHLATFKC